MLKMYKHFHLQALCGCSASIYGREALVAGSVWWFCQYFWDRGTCCRLCAVVLSVFMGQRHLSPALSGGSVSIYGTEALFAGFVWLFCQYLWDRGTCCSESELLRVRPCWFALYQKRSEKGWLRTMYKVAIQARHVPNVTNLVKMALFTVVFL